MKRILVLLLIVFLVACGSDNEKDINDETDNETVEESKTDLQEAWEQSKETDKELYITMLNMLLNEYDDNYDIFDTEIAINVYDLITTHPSGVEGAIDFKEAIIGVMSGEEQEVYGEYFDDVVGLEETFSHIDWSD